MRRRSAWRAILALPFVVFNAVLVWIGVTKGFDEVDTPLLVGSMVFAGATAGRVIRSRIGQRREVEKG